MAIAELQQSITFRLFAVIVLTVALAVPIAMVWIVVELRSDYELEVANEISQGWGSDQVLSGPFLHLQSRIPGTEQEDGSTSQDHVQSYFFTPAEFTVQSTSEHEIREKGIFKKPVFLSNIKISGKFAIDLDEFTVQRRLDPTTIESCGIVLAVSSSQAIRSLEGQMGVRPLHFEPANLQMQWQAEPIAAALETTECSGGSFELALAVRGSNRQAIALVGNTSKVTMQSTWPHPKFKGRQLPDDHDISEGGFSAHWTSNALARGFASELDLDEWQGITDTSAVGFTYHDPITVYRMVTRAVKYGFFVVGLTLLAVFCLEMLSHAKIHPIQYGVVGAGLALFYLLLLSFSEHIGFPTAYVVASSALTLLISGYSWFSTRNARFAITVTVLLGTIYGALYLCLSSTDYALLIGSLMMVVLLIGLMFATRNLANH